MLGPLDPERASTGRHLTVPVSITVSGLRRNRVDPGVWEALDRAGRYSDSTASGAVHIELDCTVDNPVDAGRPS
jgi:hypothetical protein